MRCGALPEDLGLIDISPVEMMFWLYCPVYTPAGGWHTPANLRQFDRILIEAALDYGDEAIDRYVYLTAKTLFVSGDYIGNRPGWHADGFGTNDVNYIWYDGAPTEFYAADLDLPDDCANSMDIMEREAVGRDIITYPVKHLLKLTPAVIHRSPVGFASGMRTFVKVSVSTERYNLEGNSINHGLTERWPLVPRFPERNHPARDYEPAPNASGEEG